MSTEKHGKSRKGKWSPEYYTWASMIQRCTNPKRNNWHLYGGRGIKVCDRWMKFDNFYSDMGVRPDKTSLGRIDPNGDYCKSNCEWQDHATQARSRRPEFQKLTSSEAEEIRNSDKSWRALGYEYGVSKTMIGFIKRGIEWL